jgi:predicted transcriptional regulator
MSYNKTSWLDNEARKMLTTIKMKLTKLLSIDAPGLGEQIKKAREADPRALTTICRLVGMSTQNWYRIEREEQSLPIETLQKIEQVLGVAFGYQFDETTTDDLENE